MSATLKGTATMTVLGSRVRELRLARGMSQRALAEQVKVGFPYISKVENGLETPSEDLLVLLASALDTSADDLVLLADRIPAEIGDIIRDKSTAATFLRKWKSGEISDEDVNELIRKNER